MTAGVAGWNFATNPTNLSPEQVAQELKLRADDALYVAKQTQKGSAEVFNPQDSRIIARRAQRQTPPPSSKS